MVDQTTPVCEFPQCKNASTTVLRDMYVNWVGLIAEYTPVNQLHYYCSEHARESERIDITSLPWS